MSRARSGLVLKAVSTGKLVEMGEPGEAARRERRRLDLVAVLESIRLFEHHVKKRPKAAEDHRGDEPST